MDPGPRDAALAAGFRQGAALARSAGAAALTPSGSGEGGFISRRRRSVTTRVAPPRDDRVTSTRCSSSTSRATTLSSASVSPATQSACVTCGRPATTSSRRCSAASVWRPSVSWTKTRSGKPATSGSSRAAMPATTPEAFRRRRRCIVAVGDRPTSRASSTFGRSASRWSSSEELYVEFVKLNRPLHDRLLRLHDETCDRLWLLDADLPNIGSMALLPHPTARSSRSPPAASCSASPSRSSKVALGWLDPAWLDRRPLRPGRPRARVRGPRAACALRSPRPSSPGAASGYGAMVLLQNAGVERTSAGHAALLFGRRARPRRGRRDAGRPRARAAPLAWLGFGVALGGVGLVAGSGGGVVARPATGSCCCRRSARRRSSSPRRSCSTAATRSRSRPCRWPPRRSSRCPVALAGGPPPGAGRRSAGEAGAVAALVVAGHAAAVRVLRLRPGARAAGGRGRVRQPRAARRRRASPCSRSATPSARCRRSARARSSPGSRSAADAGRPRRAGRRLAARLSRRCRRGPARVRDRRRCRRHRPAPARSRRASARRCRRRARWSSVVVVVVVVVRSWSASWVGRRRGRRGRRAAAVLSPAAPGPAVARRSGWADSPMLSPEIALAASPIPSRGADAQDRQRRQDRRPAGRHRSSMTVVSGRASAGRSAASGRRTSARAPPPGGWRSSPRRPSGGRGHARS